VNGHCCHADLFEFPCEKWGRETRSIPAQPHFDGHGYWNGFNNGLRQPESTVGIAHHPGARTVTGYTLHGAAHVDVDGIDTTCNKELRRFGHDGSFAAKNLDGKRAIFRVRLDHLQSAFAAAEQSAGIDEVRGGQTDTANAANDAAKWKSGEAGQW
jgi:hypothetical protein